MTIVIKESRKVQSIFNNKFTISVKYINRLIEECISSAQKNEIILSMIFMDDDSGKTCDDSPKVNVIVQNVLGTEPTITNYNVFGLNITGDVKDLPRVTEYLNLEDTDLTGDVSDLPRVTEYLNINGCDGLKGKFIDLPRVTGGIELARTNLTGRIEDLPMM